jgi:hypothetical protein
MKCVELALKAGRARQSGSTQFVHYPTLDLIPVYENFCFALTLFRTKVADNILEGKALLEKLFAFQTAEGFPVYLHEYPACKSKRLQQRLSWVAQLLLRDFSTVLGDALKLKLGWLVIPMEPIEPKSAEEWAEALIRGEVKQFGQWNREVHCFTGPQKQDGSEPAVTLLDLVLGESEGRFSKRALSDHPSHLYGGLIYSTKIAIEPPQESWIRRFWGCENKAYSALLDAEGSLVEEGDCLYIDLPEKEVHDEMEIAYYLTKTPATFQVGGVSTTTFKPGEVLEVRLEMFAFELKFEAEGGRFWGHIQLGNRPGQLACTKFSAYDWKIGIRTIERRNSARVKLSFRVK